MDEIDNQPQPEAVLAPAEARMQTLKILAMNLRSAKRQEESTKANRIAVEETIAALIPGKEVGQVTERFPDGSGIVVTRGLNYKADLSEIEGIFATLETSFNEYPPIETKTTRKLDIKGYEWYRENSPEIFQQLTQHVTITSKKVAVELKPVKGE